MRGASTTAPAYSPPGGPIRTPIGSLRALPCWAGVVPIRTVVGNAVPDARLLVDPARPPSLAQYEENASLDEVLLRAARAE